MSTFKLAWRNIWRNKRRTLATVTAMVIAVFITIAYSGMVAGMLVQLESDTLDFELGSAQIFAPGYQDRPSIYTNIEDSPGIIERLDAAGLKATSRLKGAGLVAAGDASAGAFFLGIDLERDPQVLELHTQIKEGAWLAADKPKGVVIGRKLAHTLGVGIGDEIVALSQATDGSTANDLFQVQGILKGVGEALDRGGIFMSQALFRELLVYEGGAHQIIIERPEVMDLDAVKASAVAAAPGQDVQTWRELNPTLSTMLDSVAGMINIMFFIVNIAIGIVILNAMLMSVFERIKEFGVLKALGISPAGVMKLIYAESMMQVAIAVTLGVGLSLPTLWYLSTVGINMGVLAGTDMMGMAMMEIWYAVLKPEIFTGPIGMTLFVVSAAVFYPALKAALIQPVAAMRHQ